jgi:hypothetical protein
MNEYDEMCADDHDGRKDECVCDWSGLPGDFDPDPSCPQHGRGSGSCTCRRGPEGIETDPACPRHGERPWAVCSECNYDRHQCPGCGKPMPHGGLVACTDCDTGDLPPTGVIVYEVGQDPYDDTFTRPGRRTG